MIAVRVNDEDDAERRYVEGLAKPAKVCACCIRNLFMNVDGTPAHVCP